MKGNVFQFHVKEGCEPQFIKINERDWPDFFKESPHYRGTEIVRVSDPSVRSEEGSETPLVYWVIDRWDSQKDFEDFKESRKEEYYGLVSTHEELYEKYEKLGWMECEPKVYAISHEQKTNTVLIEAGSNRLRLSYDPGINLKYIARSFFEQNSIPFEDVGSPDISRPGRKVMFVMENKTVLP